MDHSGDELGITEMYSIQMHHLSRACWVTMDRSIWDSGVISLESENELICVNSRIVFVMATEPLTLVTRHNLAWILTLVGNPRVQRT